MQELRTAEAAAGTAGLEEIFLKLTGGDGVKELILAARGRRDEHVSRAAPGSGGAKQRVYTQPAVLQLLSPKLADASAAAWLRRATRSAVLVMGFVGADLLAIVFGIIYRCWSYFRATPGVGDLLAGKLLG
jgi:hypothetical protein